jgi:DNA helicase-2/ATP-dependent DNA helicase PcrA
MAPSDWSRSSASAGGGGRATSRQAPSFGSAQARPPEEVPKLATGDRVTHDVYGLGTVVAIEGAGAKAVARIEFPNEGVKRLALRFAPVTKL